MRGREEKEGEGKKKDEQGREENIFKCAGEGFQQCYVLKTFPSTLKDEGKGRKKLRMEGKIIFSNILGSIQTSKRPKT